MALTPPSQHAFAIITVQPRCTREQEREYRSLYESGVEARWGPSASVALASLYHQTPFASLPNMNICKTLLCSLASG